MSQHIGSLKVSPPRASRPPSRPTPRPSIERPTVLRRCRWATRVEHNACHAERRYDTCRDLYGKPTPFRSISGIKHQLEPRPLAHWRRGGGAA